MVEFGQNVQNSGFRIRSLPRLFLGMTGRKDLGIGSYKMSWRVDMPFDSFGHIGLPEVKKYITTIFDDGFTLAVALSRMRRTINSGD